MHFGLIIQIDEEKSMHKSGAMATQNPRMTSNCHDCGFNLAFCLTMPYSKVPI